MLEIGLSGAVIELPGKIFLRGQTLKGSARILAEYDLYTAKEVEVSVERKETYRQHSRDYGYHTRGNGYRTRGNYRSTLVKEPLFMEENVEITQAEKVINFTYTIPEDTPFTFDSGLARIQWRVVLSVKSGILPRIASRDFVVLPHRVTAESPPPADEIPTPVCKVHSDFTLLYRPFHGWRYTGRLHKSSQVSLVLDEEEYAPGDKVRGNVYVTENFGSGTLSIYLVFLNKSNYHGDTSEEEHLVARTEGTFYQGSGFPFSCIIPLTGYPTFETISMRLWWVIRVVLSTPLKFTKVVEKEVLVNPLVF